MKKQITALLLVATLLPCNAYAAENDFQTYQNGMITYDLPSDYITLPLSGDYTESEVAAYYSLEDDAYFTIYALKMDTENLSEDLTDILIDSILATSSKTYKDKDNYVSISNQEIVSSLGTKGYLSSSSFTDHSDTRFAIEYRFVYEDLFYSCTYELDLFASDNWSDFIIDFDNSLKPAEVLTDTATVQKIQELLNQQGYDCGIPDGIAGANTEVAIKNYQKNFGLLETGKITNKLLESLTVQSEKSDGYTDLANSEQQTELQTDSQIESSTEDSSADVIEDDMSYLDIQLSGMEKRTTAVVDKLASIAKNDALSLDEDDVKEIIDIIREHFSAYYDGEKCMELYMYYGYLLDYAFDDSDPRSSLGINLVQAIKYVYREAESIDDNHTQENLKQIQKSLENIPE